MKFVFDFGTGKRFSEVVSSRYSTDFVFPLSFANTKDLHEKQCCRPHRPPEIASPFELKGGMPRI